MSEQEKASWMGSVGNVDDELLNDTCSPCGVCVIYNLLSLALGVFPLSRGQCNNFSLSSV